MSIPVPLAELATTLADYPWGYLITVGPDLRAHVLAVPTDLREGVFHMDGGNATRNNAAQRPEVTMVFPSPAAGAYSLVVDGNAVVHAGHLTFHPARAVLHRPAVAAGG